MSFVAHNHNRTIVIILVDHKRLIAPTTTELSQNNNIHTGELLSCIEGHPSLHFMDGLDGECLDNQWQGMLIHNCKQHWSRITHPSVFQGVPQWPWAIQKQPQKHLSSWLTPKPELVAQRKPKHVDKYTKVLCHFLISFTRGAKK